MDKSERTHGDDSYSRMVCWPGCLFIHRMCISQILRIRCPLAQYLACHRLCARILAAVVGSNVHAGLGARTKSAPAASNSLSRFPPANRTEAPLAPRLNSAGAQNDWADRIGAHGFTRGLKSKLGFTLGPFSNRKK